MQLTFRKGKGDFIMSTIVSFEKRSRGIAQPNPDSATSKAKEFIKTLALDAPFRPESYTAKDNVVKPDFARYRRALVALAEDGGQHVSGYTYDNLHFETGIGKDAEGNSFDAMVLVFGKVTPKRRKSKTAEVVEAEV